LVLGLGVCGTGLAYVLYYFVVAKLGALVASSVTYIPPVVALVIGVLLVGEQVDAFGYLAILFILSGVAILQFGKRAV
jgi:drug/metabolite transporter (DMT)-like permease